MLYKNSITQLNKSSTSSQAELLESGYFYLSRAERTAEVPAVSRWSKGEQGYSLLSSVFALSHRQTLGCGAKPHARVLPPGHRFFSDCERETCARLIEWSLGNCDDAWFVTQTFKSYVNPLTAVRMNEQWIARLNVAIGGHRLRWVRATEWQRRQVIHFHQLVLVCDSELPSRKRWEHRWKSVGGGLSRIYDADRKAAPYLAKYLNKRLGGELQMGGAWLGYHTPASVSCCGVRERMLLHKLTS